MMRCENELWATVPLEGEWNFRLGEGEWRTIAVPGAWELQVGDLLTEGPAVYRRKFYLASVADCLLLECDAISFAATIWVNGIHMGTHTGLWSAFQVDVTHAVRVGDNEIEIVVWKPGERYALRECLAGFLPDVANTFGGIWQGVRLWVCSGMGFDKIKVIAHEEGALHISGSVTKTLDELGWVCRVDVVECSSGRMCKTQLIAITQSQFNSMLKVSDIASWKLDGAAALYEIMFTLLNPTQQPVARTHRRIGFRSISALNGMTMLNSDPLHVRGVLSWGWDAQRLCPTPSRDEAHAMFTQCRALGFNLVKLCLFVPDETLFDVADETGRMLWLELPMWLPHVTPALKELALREYEAILRRVHHHPSVALVSLGCELDDTADAPFLQQLGALVRTWLPNALHCQNSGSAEAYGGVINDNNSDFYDYHFYAEPHFFQPLVDHFSRAYLPDKPWIYGEFCDADTLRNFDNLTPGPSPGRSGETTWWLAQPLTMQRDELTWLQEYETRLAAAGITDGGKQLAALGCAQASAIRKFIIEQTRKRSATGGYVVTGWQDTPITTSGMVDDAGALKFDPHVFAQFNAERVLVLDRERRREWTQGGDRPVHHDPFVVWQGEPFELHISLSNGSTTMRDAQLTWQLDDRSGVVDDVAVGAGGLQETLALPMTLPITSAIQQHTLNAVLQDTLRTTQNQWPLWSVPKQAIDFSRVVNRLDEVAIERAKRGERMVVWLREPDKRFTQPMPFWREAIHVQTSGVLAHVAADSHVCNQTPEVLRGADLRFFGVATDFALDLAKTRQILETGQAADVRSLWRRFDARAMTWAEYVIEAKIGAGSLVISTLRFAGGLGAQPSSLEMNPMGSWLLALFLA